jgi:hypothetical protein
MCQHDGANWQKKPHEQDGKREIIHRHIADFSCDVAANPNAETITRSIGVQRNVDLGCISHKDSQGLILG